MGIRNRGEVRLSRSFRPFSFLCFKRWVKVPAEFTRFVNAGWLAGDWTDVGETIRRCPIPQQGAFGMLSFHRAARAAYEAQIRQTAAGKEGLPWGTSPNQLAADGTTCQSVAGLEMRQPEVIAPGGTPIPPPLVGKKGATSTRVA